MTNDFTSVVEVPVDRLEYLQGSGFLEARDDEDAVCCETVRILGWELMVMVQGM